MTRSTLLAAPLAILCATTATAQDAASLYLEAFGGLSRLSGTDLSFDAIENDTGFDAGLVAGGAVGYDFANSPFRAELEFIYRSADGSDVEGDFASTTLALNGYYDFPEIGSGIRPYVGAGIGAITEIDYDVTDGATAGEYSDRGGALGQAMVGLSYDLSSALTLSGELRYFDAGSRTLSRDGGGTVEADYSGAELTVGLAYRF